jgi:predicted kinase
MITRRPRLIIPIGPAGCGKTYYFYKLPVQKNYVSRISADKIRNNYYYYDEDGFDPEFEDMVWKCLMSLFMRAIQRKDDIYLDCTNLTKIRRQVYVNIAYHFKYEIKMVLFRIPAMVVLQRNKDRKRQAPEKIICRQIASLQEPEPDEYDILEEIKQ